MNKDKKNQDEHNALLRSVDDKLGKIDEKILLASRMVGEARETLAEVKRVELLIERAKRGT